MELWDIYDIDRVRTGRVAQRGKPASEGGLGEGEYHLVVHICVFNGRGQLLLQQRQKDKEGYPNLWDVLYPHRGEYQRPSPAAGGGAGR